MRPVVFRRPTMKASQLVLFLCALCAWRCPVLAAGSTAGCRRSCMYDRRCPCVPTSHLTTPFEGKNFLPKADNSWSLRHGYRWGRLSKKGSDGDKFRSAFGLGDAGVDRPDSARAVGLSRWRRRTSTTEDALNADTQPFANQRRILNLHPALSAYSRSGKRSRNGASKTPPLPVFRWGKRYTLRSDPHDLQSDIHALFRWGNGQFAPDTDNADNPAKPGSVFKWGKRAHRK